MRKLIEWLIKLIFKTDVRVEYNNEGEDIL